MASNVGIIAWKSAHQNGKFLKVPDLKDARDCEEMLEDNWTPFEGVENSRMYPPEMRVHYSIPEDEIPLAVEEWKKQGYDDGQIEAMLKK